MKQLDMISLGKWYEKKRMVDLKGGRENNADEKLAKQGGFTFQVRLLDLKCKKLAWNHA